jgi:hypothetical protein
MSEEGSQESKEGTELVKASAAVFSSGGITNGSIYLPLMVMFPRAAKLWSTLARSMPDKRLNMLNEVRMLDMGLCWEGGQVLSWCAATLLEGGTPWRAIIWEVTGFAACI